MSDNDVRRISFMTRLDNTKNGNPRYRVTLANGDKLLTENDSAVANIIDSSEYRDVPVRLKLRDGRIVGIERV